MEKVKKLFAIVGIIALTSFLMSITAFAEGTVYPVNSVSELTDALTMAVTGDTIKLMADIDYPQEIYINGYEVIFNLNGYSLNVTSSNTALTVDNSGKVSLIGEGMLNVNGGEGGYGVCAKNNGSAEVTNATANGTYSYAAYTFDGGSVTILGSAIGSGFFSRGAYAFEGGTIIIGGNAQADGEGSVGACAYSSSLSITQVSVAGDAIANGAYCSGARAEGIACTVEVKQAAKAIGSCGYGANASYGGCVKAGEAAATGENSNGAYTYEESFIEITGNVAAIGMNSQGVSANYGGRMEVGSVLADGDDCIGVSATGLSTSGAAGSVKVSDRVITSSLTKCTGVLASDGGTIEVGSVRVTSSNLTGSQISYSARCGGDGSIVNVVHCIEAEGTGVVGVDAYDNGMIEVGEQVSVTGTYNSGVSASLEGRVKICGNVISSGDGGYGVLIQNKGNVMIEGSITINGAHGTGASISDSGTVLIGKDVTAVGTYSVAASIMNEGSITMEGYVDASRFADLSGTEISAENGKRNGNYIEYTKGKTIVKVKFHANLKIKTSTLPDAVVGVGYMQTIAVDYTGSEKLYFSGTGFPEGISINSDTGLISGTPAQNTNLSSPFHIALSVTDGTLHKSITIQLVVTTGAALPIISVNPGDVTKNCGEKAIFTVTATSSDGGVLTYQWQQSANGGTNWVNASGTGKTGVTYTTDNLTYANNGYLYRCLITNTKNGTSGVAYSREALLTVNPEAVQPSITTQPTSMTKSVNQTATLLIIANASDNGTLSYQWQKYTKGWWGYSWSDMSGQKGTSYTTGVLKLSDSGTKYRCIVTNSKNGTAKAVESNIVTLTVTSDVISIITTTLDAATTGLTYSQNISYSYTGSSNITFHASGLPIGLSMNASSGTISGKPVKGTADHSPYSVIIDVTDGALVETRIFSLQVKDPYVTPTVTPTITPTITPTVTPTITPTVTPTVTPIVTPTVTPTVTPSVTPVVAPTSVPSQSPTIETPAIAPDPEPSDHVSFETIVATISLVATKESDTNASLIISDRIINEAILAAQYEQREQQKTTGGIGITLEISMPKGVTSLSLSLTRTSLQNMLEANVSTLQLNNAPVSLGLDQKAIQEINRQSGSDITVHIEPVKVISQDVQSIIGTRPLYSIIISYTIDNNTQNITDLGKGKTTLSIPYTPNRHEATGSLYGVYIDVNGIATLIPDSVYDENSNSLLLNSNHFSLYGVGYAPPKVRYKDITDHWAEEYIDFMISRGLMSGTSVTKFSPDTAISRELLLDILDKLAGMSSLRSSYIRNFLFGNYHRPYLGLPGKLGAMSMFKEAVIASHRNITHEEMDLLLQIYAKAIGTRAPVTQFNPKSIVTRAEAAARIYQFITNNLKRR